MIGFTGVLYDRESSRRPTPTFQPDRICAQKGCETVLSIYNSELKCAEHRVPKHSSAHVYRAKGTVDQLTGAVTKPEARDDKE